MNNNVEKEKKPIYKKWWAWVIAVFLLSGIGSAMRGGNNSASSSVPAQTAVSEWDYSSWFEETETSKAVITTIAAETSTVVSETTAPEQGYYSWFETSKTSEETTYIEGIANTDTIYTVDELCSFLVADEDFVNNHKDWSFTIIGITDNKLYTTVDLNGEAEGNKIECKFEKNSQIYNIKNGASAIISGSLSPYATSRIVLRECTVVEFENPAEEVSENTKTQTEYDIWETEIAEPTEAIETTVMITAETEQPATWETVGDKKAEKTYVLNTSTLKIHSPGCSSVKDIKPENYSETNDYDAAISQGYKPCGRCHAR